VDEKLTNQLVPVFTFECVTQNDLHKCYSLVGLDDFFRQKCLFIYPSSITIEITISLETRKLKTTFKRTKNYEERYSAVPRLSGNRYSAKESKRKMEI